MRHRRRHFRARNHPPLWPIQVNRSSPQAQGLRYWWPFIQQAEGRTVREMVRGSHGTMDASMDTDSWVRNTYNGRAIDFDGTSGDEINIPDEDGLSLPATGCSVVLWFEKPSWVSGDGFLGKWNNSAREWLIWTGGTANEVEFGRYVGATGHFATVTNSGFYNDTPTLAVGRTNGAGQLQIAAWNAALGLQTATGSTQSWTTSGFEDLVIGNYRAGAARNVAAKIWDVRIYDRYLADADVMDIVDYPSNLAWKPRRVLYFPAPAAGGVVTFAAGLDGSADLSADLGLVAGFGSALNANATLAPDLGMTASLVSSFNGSADLVSSISPLRGLVAGLVGSADMAADIGRVRGLIAAFAGDATLAPDLSLIASFLATFNGSADLAAELGRLRGLVAGFSASADLVADIEIVAGIVELAITLAAAATLAADVSPLRGFDVGFQGDAGLIADMSPLRGLASALQGDATLAPDLSLVASLTAALAGSATLSADITPLRGLVADLQAGAVMTGDLKRLRGFEAALQGDADLAAQLNATFDLAAALLGQAVFSATLSLVDEPPEGSYIPTFRPRRR
ncbi:MAG: hypothetical protein ACR2QC_07995 [Gammaproteobacteria bacterium]